MRVSWCDSGTEEYGAGGAGRNAHGRTGMNRSGSVWSRDLRGVRRKARYRRPSKSRGRCPLSSSVIIRFGGGFGERDIDPVQVSHHLLRFHIRVVGNDLGKAGATP